MRTQHNTHENHTKQKWMQVKVSQNKNKFFTWMRGRRELSNYQKAVKLKKLVVVAMEAIDPAAKMNCEILRTSPRTVPGVPQKSFIFLHQIKINAQKPQCLTMNNHLQIPDQCNKTNHQWTKKVRLLSFNIHFTPTWYTPEVTSKQEDKTGKWRQI